MKAMFVVGRTKICAGTPTSRCFNFLPEKAVLHPLSCLDRN